MNTRTIRKYDILIDKDITYIKFEQKNGNRHLSLIDTFNLDKFLSYEFSWHVGLYRDYYYVNASPYIIENGIQKRKLVFLHYFLLDFPDCKYIDHANNNTLDNREFNLRPANNSENLKNRQSKNRNNKSGYRNVSWISGWYRIQLQLEGKNYMFPEKFKDVDEAGVFAKEVRLKYYGEFAGNG